MFDNKIKLLELSKKVSKFCVGAEGNVSTKIKTSQNYSIVIKASGTKLFNLSEDDLVDFDSDGKQISNLNKKGSMELGFHTYLLSFDDINFVSHTHPVNTLKILCSQNPQTFAEYRLFPDQVVFNGGKSCLIPYVKPGDKLTFMVKKYVEDFIKKEGYFPKLILLQNHGIITCGKNIEECLVSSEICEKSAEVFILNNDYSKFLTKKQVIELLEDKQEKYRQENL